MPQPLISARDLVVTSWKQFLQDWKQTLEISVWLIAPGAIMLAGAYAARPFTDAATAQISSAVFEAIGFFLTLVITMRLELFVLRKDRVRSTLPKDLKPITKELIFSFLFIALIELAAIVGGLVAFVLPGIWLAVALMFSRYAFLEDGTRGIKALEASFALVKKRWWEVFWRTVACSLVFTPLIVLALFAITMIISAIAGADQAALIFHPSDAVPIDPIAKAIRYTLESIVQVILLPLFVTWQVKLFHALKDSR